MAQRRHHYEQAFEAHLRAQRVPYVAVDEARKALLPEAGAMSISVRSFDGVVTQTALKSFDFVIYGKPEGAGAHVLAEVKGRRVGRRPSGGRAPAQGENGRVSVSARRLDSWVTLEDIESLRVWERLFGPEFRAAFVFVYWCDEVMPDGLFQESFDHRGRWYAVRAVLVEDYARVMRTRSPRWGTVHVPPPVFERISQPLILGPNARLSLAQPDALPLLDTM
ncbi:MAG: HYExAFE family protein [Phycisphaerae bacterium]|nr:HYExAFE family protein [Phycisphaerae bacterium]